MSIGSSDEILIDLNIFEIGTIKAIFYRHLSPFSVEAIMEKIPLIIRGRFNFMGPKTHWMLSQIGISVGADSKALKKVETGDIVYCPQTDSIYIFIDNDELTTKVNKIGKINDLNELELFKKVKNGVNTKLNIGI